MSLMQITTTTYDAKSNLCENDFLFSVHEQNEQDFYRVIDSIQGNWGNSGNVISTQLIPPAPPVPDMVYHEEYEEDSLRLNILRCAHNAFITKVSKGNKPLRVEVEIDRYGAQSLKYVTVTLPINHWLSILENNWLDTLVDFLENTKRGGMSEHRMNQKITDLMDYFYNYMVGNAKPVAMFTYLLPFDGRHSYCVECDTGEHLHKFEQSINMLAQLEHDGSAIEYNGQVLAYPNYTSSLFVAVNASECAQIELVKPSLKPYGFRDYSDGNDAIYGLMLPIDEWYAILTQGLFAIFVDRIYCAEHEGYSKDWINDNFLKIVEDVLNN